jgi:aryl-alcohol dehydrogenase-like predicted oxidoreductase
MQRRQIGSLDVSVVGIGTNNFGTTFFGAGCDQETTTAIVDTALECGVNFFDTAEEYSITGPMGTGRSEEFLRVALGSRRDAVVIATKFLVHDPASPEQRGGARIVQAVEGSLRRLGTDRIDLYQQHTPDPDVPIEETLEVLDRLVQAGKVREIGCCNFDGAMITAADEAARSRGLTRFVSAQNSYSVLDAGRGDDPGTTTYTGSGNSAEELADRNPSDFVRGSIEHDLRLIPYFPLANGLLTGKYRRGVAPPSGSRLTGQTSITQALAPRVLSEVNLNIVERLEEYARDCGRTLLELAISWLVSQPVVGTVIAGVSRPNQIQQNASAASWTMTASDFDAIQAIVQSEMRRGAAQDAIP